MMISTENKMLSILGFYLAFAGATILPLLNNQDNSKSLAVFSIVNAIFGFFAQAADTRSGGTKFHPGDSTRIPAINLSMCR